MKKILISFLAVMVLTAFTTKNVKGQAVNDTAIVINEIFYNPPNSSDDSLEFIELYNRGNVAINMQGFIIKSPSVGTSSINITLPDITIDAGGYLVLAADSIVMSEYFGIAAIEWNINKSLNNTSKDIVLFDNMNRVLDSVTYCSSSPWPSISSSGGPSIELLSPLIDNTIATNWEKSTQEHYLIKGSDTLLTVYCSPGMPNINHRPIVQFSSDKRIVSLGETVVFMNESLNYDTAVWTFDGGTPTTSENSIQNVVYEEYGLFDVGLFVANGFGNVMLEKPNYISVYPECEVVNALPYQVGFSEMPQCWFSYPSSGDGSWALDNVEGHGDSSSMKFDCDNYSADTHGTLHTVKFDVSSYSQASISFYYYCPDNCTTVSKAPKITINTYSEDFEVTQTEDIPATKNESWAFFTMSLTSIDKYCTISVTNKVNNNAVYIDDFIIQDRPGNSSMISGTIDIDGLPLTGILVKFLPGDVVAITDGNGFYSAYIENSWTGLVMPSNPQYLYEPAYIEVFDLQNDISDIDFDAVQLPDGWIFMQTANSHTFCVPRQAVDTAEISDNSWVGAFYEGGDGEKYCCGAMQIRADNNHCFNAWAANPETSDPGFTENQQIFWKIFESSSEKIYDAEVSYASGPELFTIDGVTSINHLEINKITQTVIVPSGWTGISSYVIPYESDLSNIIGEYSSDVVIMLNDDGSYVPGVNSELTQWNADEGWLIKAKNTIILNFTGKYNPNLNVDFEQGWTLFPVKTDVAVSIDSVFGNTDKLDIIKGYGAGEIYVPGITQSFELKPGKSYKARLNAPFSINFEETRSIGDKHVINIDSTEEITLNGKSIMTSMIDHVVLIDDTDILINGDTVLVYSQSGVCYGLGIVDESGKTIFRVYGDDPTTDIVDGMEQNEKMDFILIRGGKRYELGYAFNNRTIDYEYFITDGFTYISRITMKPAGIEKYKESEFYVYPNPVNNNLYIYSSESIGAAKCKLIDILGRVVKEIILNDNVTVVDISELNSGFYILNMEGKAGIMTRSVIKN